ncbi:MAG: NAD(P)H-hydrate dehydratase [Desulfobacteraceae bacterium]|nr:NAD(P)H-hydrate dehydratase [Desulfobacteraceae bacterium]
MIIVTASEMQAMDHQTIRDYGIPGRVLMENAGRGATRTFLHHVYQNCRGAVGILAGRGNNGGDGFVIARYLAQKGIDVSVYLLCQKERVQGDAKANLNLLPALNVRVAEICQEQDFNRHISQMRHKSCWVDAVLGTGLKSDVTGLYRQALEFLNDQKRPVLAVDIPSGLNADTGQACGVCVRATATATFGFAKIGHVVYPGAQFCGTLDVIDIGIPPFIAEKVNARQRLITPDKIVPALQPRDPQTHKGNTGHALIIAGSEGKTGAAVMTANAALKAGAGLVSLAVPQCLNQGIEARLTEAMTIALPDEGKTYPGITAMPRIKQEASGKTCLALGPGIGTGKTTCKLVEQIIRQIDLPLVIDADGLNCLAQTPERAQGPHDCIDQCSLTSLKERKAPAVLTPHPGEMARLTGYSTTRIQSDRAGIAREFAITHNVILVLKGARTIVAEPDGTIWINPTGNPAMASGGMGDVLTGIIAGLITQGVSPSQGARAGVYLHGLAADKLNKKAPWGYLATEVIQTLPEALNATLKASGPVILNQPVL